jgi:hypothetical protein
MMGMTPPPSFSGVGYNDSHDEANCGGCGYNGDGVNKKMPAKKDAPINVMRNMASKFFNWVCTLHFKIQPQEQKKRPL